MTNYVYREVMMPPPPGSWGYKISQLWRISDFKTLWGVLKSAMINFCSGMCHETMTVSLNATTSTINWSENQPVQGLDTTGE